VKSLDKLKFATLSLLLAVGLAACDKPGPAESAGKKMDQTAEDAGRNITQAADKAGNKMSEQSAKTGVAIEDTEITTKVKGGIFAEPGLKTLQISVDTVKGVVTLTGAVDSPLSRDKAITIARSVAGVSEVENHLVLKPSK
jgi:osmotically-inducible protein OsmY